MEGGEHPHRIQGSWAGQSHTTKINTERIKRKRRNSMIHRNKAPGALGASLSVSGLEAGRGQPLSRDLGPATDPAAGSLQCPPQVPLQQRPTQHQGPDVNRGAPPRWDTLGPGAGLQVPTPVPSPEPPSPLLKTHINPSTAHRSGMVVSPAADLQREFYPQ